MQVLKFGGTSVGSAARMKGVFQIVTADPHQKIVVLSAVSGTTNGLLAYAQLLADDKSEEAITHISALENQYHELVNELYSDSDILNKAHKFIDEKFDFLREFSGKKFELSEEKIIVAQGELISTQLFTWYVHQEGEKAILLPALDFMRIDKSSEPDEYYMKSMLEKELQIAGESPIYITQGYICRNAYGEVDNLKRGGSDYTATLIGQAIDAEEIQIWTDIDGMHNNDPRIVQKTYPVKNLSYDEAAELAYFGAKILHPSCVLPAQKAKIPIRLKNTMDPKAEGTTISKRKADGEITAVAAKDGIVAIKIKSGRMLNAYGFLKKIFEIFEQYQTPVDMVTTSEVAVSLTIDETSRLSKILLDLRHFGQVEVDHNLSIICMVGNFTSDQRGYAAKIFSAFEQVPIRMISYGGSKYNVSVLVDSTYKKTALQAVNEKLFGLDG
ncbi:MAG: aspartate kinase [Saprospiraceae bacterium]|nr:aspartate kinase [Saprospiraceae bacterium]